MPSWGELGPLPASRAYPPAPQPAPGGVGWVSQWDVARREAPVARGREETEERAAIGEYDGGLDRSDAEAQAARDIGVWVDGRTVVFDVDDPYFGI